LTLFLTPKGVGIGREKGVAFERDLTNLHEIHASISIAIRAWATFRAAVGRRISAGVGMGPSLAIVAIPTL
ncbi:hypothetical protein, partial [Acidiphilium sp.]|uniref:hypothetical protein n=1 Tax=Acidiphilium sp. TaxID=527 RepID=UPI00259044A6